MYQPGFQWHGNNVTTDLLRITALLLIGVLAVTYGRSWSLAWRLNFALLDWLDSGSYTTHALPPAPDDMVARLQALDQEWPDNPRLHWHTAAAHVIRGEVEPLIQIAPKVSPGFIALAEERGARAMQDGDLDTALGWYLLGAQFPDDTGVKSLTELARACQRTYAEAASLGAQARGWCSALWQMSGGNLIINGQFTRGRAVWAHLIAVDETDVVYQVDPQEGLPAPSLAIQGRTSGYHGGMFQRIHLPQAQPYTFRMAVKTAGSSKFRVELLVWQTAGEEHVPFQLHGTHDWQYVDTVIETTVPDAAFIAPVRVFGEGQVWIDDVSLTPYSTSP